MELMFGLAAVDRLDGGRRTKQLADGWTVRFPASGRRVRAALAGLLTAIAARLAPAGEGPADGARPAITPARP